LCCNTLKRVLNGMSGVQYVFCWSLTLV
jgi:hypothetical protein